MNYFCFSIYLFYSICYFVIGVVKIWDSKDMGYMNLVDERGGLVHLLMDLVHRGGPCFVLSYDILYLSNRPQVSMVYKLINHAGCW